MKKTYPCDNGGDCPYRAEYISTCQFCCGYGVEEDKPFNPDDLIPDDLDLGFDDLDADDLEIDWDNVDSED